MNLLNMMYSYSYLQHLHHLNGIFKFHTDVQIYLCITLFIIFSFLSFYIFEREYNYFHQHPQLSKSDKTKIIHKNQFVRKIISLCAVISVVLFILIYGFAGSFNSEYYTIDHDYHVARADHRVYKDNLKLSIYNHKYHYYKRLNQSNTYNANEATKYNRKYNSTYNYEHEHVYEGSFGRQDMPYYRPSDSSVAKQAGKMQRIPHSISYEFTSHHII